jgi:transmembrane sensor
MKPPDPLKPSGSNDITAAAVEWLLEKQDGFTAGRRAQFQAWCEADPRHALAITKAERMAEILGELPGMKDALSDRFGDDATEERGLARTRLWRPVMASIAAAAAIALVVFAIRGRPAPEEKSPAVGYVSNADRPQQVVLGDGSFVDLNSHTTIRTQMLARERRVALQDGEAHFAVAHDVSRPFIVEAAGISVRAVGTAFNIRVTDQRVEVLVLEGKVEISENRAAAAGSPTEHSQLGVADRAIFSRTRSESPLRVEKADEHELLDALAWHSRVTIISSRPLREIVELFNHRNSLRLVIADSELAERNLGGSFALDQPKTFVRALELDGDVVSEPRGENEIVLRLKR